jgi:hypothetical protein
MNVKTACRHTATYRLDIRKPVQEFLNNKKTTTTTNKCLPISESKDFIKNLKKIYKIDFNTEFLVSIL